MTDVFQKFLTDIISAGVSAAAVAVLALNLDVTTDWRVVALAAGIGFVNGVLNAARRALPTS